MYSVNVFINMTEINLIEKKHNRKVLISTDVNSSSNQNKDILKIHVHLESF